jgi:hypothetical protein
VTAVASVEGTEPTDDGTARNVLFNANIEPLSAANTLVDSLAVTCARQGRQAISRTIAAIGRFENV